MWGTCIDCPKSARRWLVDKLRCERCHRQGVRDGWLGEMIYSKPDTPTQTALATLEKPRTYVEPRTKATKLPKPPKKQKRERSYSPRPETHCLTPEQLFFLTLAVAVRQPQLAREFLLEFGQITSDVDRLVAVVHGQTQRAKIMAVALLSQFPKMAVALAAAPTEKVNRVKGLAKVLSKLMRWNLRYTAAVYRDVLDWEERRFQELLVQDIFKRGRNFVDEAADLLGWTKQDVCNTKRRVARAGIARKKQTEDVIVKALAKHGEMTISEIAQALDTTDRWVQKVISAKLADRVDYRVEGSYDRRVYWLK